MFLRDVGHFISQNMARSYVCLTVRGTILHRKDSDYVVEMKRCLNSRFPPTYGLSVNCPEQAHYLYGSHFARSCNRTDSLADVMPKGCC